MAFLTILLVTLLAVIAVTMQHGRSNTQSSAAMTQTLFDQFVTAGGHIVWFILLPMSFITIYLAVEYCITIRRKKLLPHAIGQKIVDTIQSFGTERFKSQAAQSNDLITTAVATALNQSQDDWFRIRNALFESLQEQGLALIRKIEWVNLIGNVAPMVGLFGTVVGMIILFNTIAAAQGQPHPAQLAYGIGVALVTTFWGLLIAIPALTIHGAFRNRIETLLSDAVTEIENILPQIKNGLQNLRQASSPSDMKTKQPLQE